MANVRIVILALIGQALFNLVVVRALDIQPISGIDIAKCSHVMVPGAVLVLADRFKDKRAEETIHKVNVLLGEDTIKSRQFRSPSGGLQSSIFVTGSFGASRKRWSGNKFLESLIQWERLTLATYQHSYTAMHPQGQRMPVVLGNYIPGQLASGLDHGFLAHEPDVWSLLGSKLSLLKLQRIAHRSRLLDGSLGECMGISESPVCGGSATDISRRLVQILRIQFEPRISLEYGVEKHYRNRSRLYKVFPPLMVFFLCGLSLYSIYKGIRNMKLMDGWSGRLFFYAGAGGWSCGIWFLVGLIRNGY
jgi:hypothetical protein